MIVKSYILENDPKKISNYNSILFYGINLGLKKYFKEKIKSLNKNNLILNFNQEELIKDNNLLINEISNSSLFQEKKIIFIENGTEKILAALEEVIINLGENKIIIFSETLEKKSKLRNYFEKSKDLVAVPCYEDNEITIKKIITNKLKEFRGLSPQNISLIIENCGLDRIKLDNELDKIFNFFQDKTLDTFKLETLLNLKTNDNFNLLKDEAISGNKYKTNKLLSDTVIESEKNILYLNIINQRFNKLYQIITESKLSNLEDAVNKSKPPIFWKDKPAFLTQIKKWDTSKIRKILDKSYELEINIKSNNSLNSNILIKKLLIEICELANV